MSAIRAIAPHDLEAVIRLASATPEAPQWERSVYESLLQPGSPNQAFIAEKDGVLAAFAVARIVLDICELDSIAVAPFARRSGLGSDLLAAVIEWARVAGASRLQLEVRSGNHAAIAFYQRAGFTRDGLRHAYYRNPNEDALLMSLPLPPARERAGDGGKLL
ncbi:MAG TPA: ribosomal protein S18-alanine N-acetyltransferase [Silvibacterium sp.]|nr:ribosomal protein S18-alanine N-acetyltransferase [Silvibacterium sp.]